MKLKKYYYYLIFLGFLMMSGAGFGQVIVSSHPSMVIETCSGFPTAPNAVSFPITIRETNTGDFIPTGSFETIRLKLSSGFTFASQSPLATLSDSGAEVQSAGIQLITPSELQFSYFAGGSSQLDVLSISNFKIIASSAGISGTLRIAANPNITGLESDTLLFPLVAAAEAMSVQGGTLNTTATYCKGDPAAPLSVSSTTTTATTSNTLSYQWLSSQNNIGGFSPIVGATDIDYTPLTGTAGTLYYKRTITETAQGLSCSSESNIVAITVNTIDAGEITGNETLCYNSTPSLIGSVRAPDPNTPPFEWLKSTDGGSTWTPAGGNGLTFSFSSTLTQTTQYVRVASSPSCTVTKSSNIITKTVYGPLNPGNFASARINVYKSSAPISIAPVGGTPAGAVSGTLAYQWYASSNNSTFFPIGGAVGETLEPSTNIVRKIYYQRESRLLEGTIQICSEISNTLEFNIYELIPGSISGDQSLCSNHTAADITAIGTTNASITPTGTGLTVIGYSWERSTNGGTSWQSIAGANNNTYSITTTITQPTTYRRIASVAGGTITATTNTVYKNLLDPVVGGTFATAPQIVCFGSNATPFTINSSTNSSTVTGNLTYQWERSTDNTVFTPITLNATNAAYTPSATSTGTTYYRRKTTLTNGADSCEQYSNIQVFNVIALDPGRINGDENLCYNNIPSPISSVLPAVLTPSLAGETITYVFERSTNAGNTWSEISRGIDPSYAFTGPLTQTTWYRRGVLSQNCSTIKYPDNNVVIKNVSSQLIGGTVSPIAQSLCVGEISPKTITVSSATNSSTVTGIIDYKWQSGPSSTGPFTDLVNNSSDIDYILSTTATGTTYYRRKTTIQGSSCEVFSTAAAVTVIGIDPGTVTATAYICYEAPLTLDNAQSAMLTGGSTETIEYTWQQSTVAGSWTTFSPKSTISSYNIPQGVLTQTTSYRRIATSNSCDLNTAISNPITVNVLPPLTAGAVSTTLSVNSVCVGTSPGSLFVVNGTNTTTALTSYQWYKRTVSSGAYTPIPAANSAEYNPGVLNEGTYFKRKIFYTNNKLCSVEAAELFINVTEISGGAITESIVACPGEPIFLASLTTATANQEPTYSWEYSLSLTSGAGWQPLRDVNSNIVTKESYTIPASNNYTTVYFRRAARTSNPNCTAYSNILDLRVNRFSGASTIRFSGVAGTTFENCDSQTIPAIGYNTSVVGSGVLSYTWEISKGNNTSWTSLPNSTQGLTETEVLDAIIANGSITDNFFFRRTTISTLGGQQCTQLSNEVEVKYGPQNLEIDPGTINIALSGSPSNLTEQIICPGVRPAPFSATIGTATSTNVSPTTTVPVKYKWYASTNNVSFDSIPGATAATYWPGNLNETTYFRRTVVPQIPGFTSEPNLCEYESENTLAIIVPNPGAIRSSTYQEVVCAGSPVSRLISSSSIPATQLATMNFKWYTSTDGNNFTLVSGVASENHTPSGLITQTTTYRRATTISPTDNTNGGCGQTYNADYTIQVNNVDAGSIAYGGNLKAGSSSEIELCYGQPAESFTSTTLRVPILGTRLYQWYTSTDGTNYTAVPANGTNEDYNPGTLTSTIYIKRLNGSSYTYTNTLGVFTESRCMDVSNPAHFTNAFKITVLDQVPTPAISSTANSEICATNPSPGSISIDNFVNPPSGAVVYKWYSTTDPTLTEWQEIKDPFDPSKIYGGDTYTLPQLYVETHFKVIASVLSTTACTYPSNIISIPVNIIDPGLIAFTAPTAQDAYYEVCNSANPVVEIRSKPGFEHQVILANAASSSFTVSWQSKPKDGLDFADLTFGSSYTKQNAGLLATNIGTAVYIRKKISIRDSNGYLVCEDYSNAVLLEVSEPVSVNIPNTSIFKEDPSCAGGSDGSITLSSNSNALTGGTTADRAQEVRLVITGAYSQTAKYNTALKGIPFSYTPSSKPSSLANLAANFATALSATFSNSYNILAVGSTIVVSSKTPGEVFSVSASVENGIGTAFYVEYISTSAKANTYKWTKFPVGTAALTNPDITFGNPTTLDLANLAAGRYQLQITNNLDCTTVTVPTTFDLLDPNPLLPGTINSSAGAIVCENGSTALTVTVATLPINPEYIWQKSTDGILYIPIFSGGVTATLANYTTGNLTTTTYFRRGINSKIDATTYCAPDFVYSDPIVITVNQVTPGTIAYMGLSSGGVAQVCYGQQPAAITNGNTIFTASGTPSFEWYKSEDGSNWGLIPGANTFDYQPLALTTTTKFRRKVLSSLSIGGTTLNCDPANNTDDFSNEITIEVLADIPTPILDSTANTICSSNPSSGLISIANAAAFNGFTGLVKTWESSTDGNNWTPILDASGNLFTANNYPLPLLAEKTFYRVIASVSSGALVCEKPSNPIEISVVNINPGKIDFLSSPVVENVFNTPVNLQSDILIGASSLANEQSVPGYESTYEILWEFKDMGSNAWRPLPITGNYSTIGAKKQTLKISTSLPNSRYFRRVVRQLTSPGIYCLDYSNSVLVNVLATPIINFSDPTPFITPAFCPGESSASISIPSNLILSGNQQPQKQIVAINLTGNYTRSGVLTPSGSYQVTINNTTYSYTATVSNTTLESLTASITAALSPTPGVLVSHLGNIITLTASDTATPFSVATKILNKTTDTRMSVEYVQPALAANSYYWRQLIGNTLNATSLVLSNTLELNNLAAGRYELTVSNNTPLASAVAPIFTIEDKVLLAGQTQTDFSNVFCSVVNSFSLSVANASSFAGQEYLWQSSSNGTNGWTNVLSGTASVTTATLNVQNLNSSTFYRRGLRLVDAFGVPCTSTYIYSDPLEIVVNIIAQGSIGTEELLVCAGDIPSTPIRELSAASATGSATITYLWEFKEDSPAAVWAPYASANTKALVFTTAINKTTAFRRIATNTISGSVCYSIPSNVVTITTVATTLINNAAIKAGGGVVSVSCNGLANGAITINNSDFTTTHPAPSFSWEKENDPSFGATTQSLTGLSGGKYRLTISTYTNTIGGVILPVCKAVSDWFEIIEPAALSLTVSPSCTGQIVATAAGGFKNYQYTLSTINAPDVVVITTNGAPHTFSNLIKGGTYTVTLAEVNARGCSPISQTTRVPLDLEIDATKISTTAASCFGLNDGKIAVQVPFVTGGSGTYNYLWRGPGNVSYSTRDINNLSPGDYTLTVTDALGCTASFTTTVASKAALAVSEPDIQNQILSCNAGSEASVSIVVTPDPNSAVQIKWFRGSTEIPASLNNTTVSGLNAGNYKVVVADLNSPGCQVEKFFEIFEPSPFKVSLEKTTNPLCFSANGGSATVNISGGTPPYKYSLNNGALVSIGTSSQTQLTYTITGIPAGSQNITFSDSGGCLDATGGIIPVSIVVPEELVITAGTVVPVSCTSPGSISVSVSGGTAPYSYQWIGPGLNRITTQGSISVLSGGSYTVLVTDGNKCTQTLVVPVTDESQAAFSVSGTVSPPQCSENTAGSIQLTLANIQAPYAITWESYLPKTATTTCTTDCFEWVAVPAYTGSLLLTNLAAGEYRVTVSEAGQNACNAVSKSFSIAASNLAFISTKEVAPSCVSDTGYFTFKIKSTYANKFYLNGQEISLANGTLEFSNSLQQYKIPNIASGNYTLKIVELLSGSGAVGCEIFKSFTFGAYEPITYSGETTQVLDVCNPEALSFPNTALVSGGAAFVNAANEPYYIYRWTGIETSVVTTTTASGTQQTETKTNEISFVATEAVALGLGNYLLVIEDAQGCLSDPIPFEFLPSISPLEISVIKRELNCGLNNTDGGFSLSIKGGVAPYTISWEREIPGSEEAPNPTYEVIATNALTINNLGEGRYRLKVSSNLLTCNYEPAKSFTAIYTLNKADTISIVEGPFLSKELCLGNPGYLDIKVFDSQASTFGFRYAGALVSATSLGEGTFRVIIDNPVDNAILDIVNERGCAVQVPIITGVGTPEFTYTSAIYEQSGIIGANEPVSFTNTSIDLYSRMIWYFGDGSEPLEITSENAATTEITHAYKTPGIFNVRLRFYNKLGCFKETTQEVVVGRGYLIIFPSAFTPNGDGINDVFEAKYTGIVSFEFSIYDMWGNVVFTKQVADTLLEPTNWGWDGNYPTGKPYTFNSFRYSLNAITHDQKEVNSSGEAILLR